MKSNNILRHFTLFFIGSLLQANLSFSQKIDVSPSKLTMKEGENYSILIEIKVGKQANEKDFFVGIKMSGDTETADYTFRLGTTDIDIATDKIKLTVKAGEEKAEASLIVSPVKDGKTELVESTDFEIGLFDNKSDKDPKVKTNLEGSVESDEKPAQEQLTNSLLKYYPGLDLDDVHIFLGGGLKLNGNTIFDSFAFEMFLRNPEMATLCKGWKFGIFAGMYKYSYSISDSTQNRNSMARLLDPKAELKVGTSYINNTYTNTSGVERNSLGAYIDLVFSPDQDDDFRIGVSLHLEIVNSSSKRTVTQNLERSDTLTYSLSDSTRSLVVSRYGSILINPVFKKSTDGYFGIGFPITAVKAKKYEFYFHPTFGVTTFTPANYNFGMPDFISTNVPYKQFYPFYMAKAQITERATGLGISLGCEVRGIIAQSTFYDPAFVLFVASKIDIAKLVKKD